MSKKQSVVSKGIDEVMWIRNLLNDLQIPYGQPIIIHYENKSAISLAHDHVYHDRIKHVNIDRFNIQDHLKQGILKTDHVTYAYQCADIFTKGLPPKKMDHLIAKLGMKSIHSCERRRSVN